MDQSNSMPQRPKVFLEFTVGGVEYGRVVIELYSDITRLTAENFRALCTGEKGIGICGKPLHYKGTKIFYIDPGNSISGGILFDEKNGRGGESIYGYQFKSENYTVQHDRPGVISMHNSGPHTNSSDFMIELQADPGNDENVAFGLVVDGLDVLRRISNDVDVLKQDKGEDGGEPIRPVLISDCGEIK